MEYGKITLGFTSGDDRVVRSASCVNGNVVIVGLSGSGKSGNCLKNVIQRVESGEANAVVFNWHNSTNLDSMPATLQKRYLSLRKVVDVENHIPLPLFAPEVNVYGQEEPKAMVNSRVCTILGEAGKLAPTQMNALHESVAVVNEKGNYRAEGIVSIRRRLAVLNTGPANAAIAKLRGLFDMNAFVDGELSFDKPIVEIDVNCLDRNSQRIVVTVLLEYFFAKASSGAYKDKHLILFIDECHNLDFGKSSIARTMLYETRKLGVELYLATPELPTNKNAISAILQAGTRMYFQQEDTKVRDVAKLIEASRQDKWTLYLSELKRGEFVLCGQYEINGIAYSEPVILRAFEHFEEATEESLNNPE